MALSHDEVLHLAKLAHLDLSKTEVTHFAEQLSPIVDYFNELNEVDTANVLETSQTTHLSDVLRQDVVDDTQTLSQELATSEAPITHNGFFVVPAILQKE